MTVDIPESIKQMKRDLREEMKFDVKPGHTQTRVSGENIEHVHGVPVVVTG